MVYDALDGTIEITKAAIESKSLTIQNGDFSQLVEFIETVYGTLGKLEVDDEGEAPVVTPFPHEVHESEEAKKMGEHCMPYPE